MDMDKEMKEKVLTPLISLTCRDLGVEEGFARSFWPMWLESYPTINFSGVCSIFPNDKGHNE